MLDKIPGRKKRGGLLEVLTAHFRALVAARSDETVLKEYSALLRFLKSGKAEFLATPLHGDRRTYQVAATVTAVDRELGSATLDALEALVNDGRTPRKNLEQIAIQRFSVPRGSMRSFSNRRMLVDKLLTLIANERTHETIGAVARGQSKRVPDS
jgi:hypothetical protein